MPVSSVAISVLSFDDLSVRPGMCKSNLRYDGQLLKSNALKTLFKRWLSLCSTMFITACVDRAYLHIAREKKLAVLDANRVNMAYIV